MNRAEIAKLLRTGVQADIWADIFYDFGLRDDQEDSRETLLINVQYAMNLAAEIMEAKEDAA
jgi:hypothetical protein|tara:strand:- start:211 stop:396 length:186 start_codon:yes stop_codon:yes gene_type:complete